MDLYEKKKLKEMIDKANVISFDVFDTLLFRKVNTPETIFDLIGNHFDIYGFRKLRIDEQNRASRIAYQKIKAPHADMNEIYDALSEHSEIDVDWQEVKAFEIQAEKDALTANREMLEIFRYAKNQNKRVVATSDMYLLAATLGEILESCGYNGFDHIYCSADEHKAKFSKDLFECVAEKENTAYENILHIGDSQSADVDIPSSFGIKTFRYHCDADMEKVKDTACTDIDNGMYKILFDKNKGFWYNLGIEAGGPLYMGLYNWLSKKYPDKGQKIYFLSRDGYNLCKLFRDMGYTNVQYIYTSRRALLLAGIDEINDEAIAELPPYTMGQSVGDILDYLCIPRDKITQLSKAGFESMDDIIRSVDDKAAFKKLYELEKEIFLERCAKERRNAEKYFREVGLADEKEAVVFDCGWSGSSQVLLDRFLSCIGSECKTFFCYFGIRNTEKSRKQLHKKHYDTYAFDFYNNHSLQSGVNEAVVLYELFFSAPHESVYYYGDNGVVFENGEGDKEKSDILEGIIDYVKAAADFVSKYNIEYAPEDAIGHIQRLVHFPNEEEAEKIGDLNNVDGFVRQSGVSKHIAYITEEQFENNPETEIYWLRGLLKRNDISEPLKTKIAAKHGIAYPEAAPSEYHLEDPVSLANYIRMLSNEKHEESVQELNYKTKFSVVIPVYNTVTEQLTEAIDSVLAQTYDNFELILVDDHSPWQNVVPVLRSYESDSRVKVIYRTENGHISAATNDGLAAADGEFAVFMDCDDIIEPTALYEMAKKLNDDPHLDFIYSDEDKITEDGKIRHMPFFKPEWSPDLFMSEMYTNHLAVYRLSIVKKIGGLRSAYNGSQDYDMTLRFMEQSDNSRVGHIPKVLYHWRERKESVAFSLGSKNYAAKAGCRAKEDALRRRGIKGHLEYVPDVGQYRTVYDVEGEPVISIIIPSKDNPEILRQCIDSIYGFTRYRSFEVIVVDNGSSPENKEKISLFLGERNIRYIYGIYSFNFSKMCNKGAAAAKGDFLLFLNDDIEIFQPQWLERMLGAAQQKHTGAVGAKLLYPETTLIQHAGVSNIKEGPSHNFLRCNDSFPYYFGFSNLDYNCIAVTAACLMVKRSVFDGVNGFNEKFPVAYNDVDLCFRIYEAGYYNVQRNDAIAYHHESYSRGIDEINEEKLLRLSAEKCMLYKDHPALKGYDPFLNVNIHSIGTTFDPQNNFNKTEPYSLPEYSSEAVCNIDMLKADSNGIIVSGWGYLAEAPAEDTDIHIIFTDPYDRSLRADCIKTERRDVAAAFNNDSLCHCGFESILDTSALRPDIFPYKVGVEIIGSSGKKAVKWTDRTTDMIFPKTVSKCSDHSYADKLSLIPCSENTVWSIDINSVSNRMQTIQGFAFCEGNDHFRYKKQLILKDTRDRAFIFDTEPVKRLDVAATFPEIHYLFSTGFRCTILRELLEKNNEYEVYIRLYNIADTSDIRDIATGQKVLS